MNAMLDTVLLQPAVSRQQHLRLQETGLARAKIHVAMLMTMPVVLISVTGFVEMRMIGQ